MTKAARQPSLDFLRLLLMLMIVGLHALYFGGNLLFTAPGRTLALAYGIEGLFVPAVNCFVLISGYFSIDSSFRWNKLLSLWGQALFYSVLFTALYHIVTNTPLSPGAAVSALFPVITRRWWFVSAFLPLYLVSGYINRLLQNLSQREWKRLLIIGFFLFVVWSSLRPLSSRISPLVDADGYSFLFFCYLYAVGGYLKRCPLPKVPAALWGALYLAFAGITCLLAYQSRLSTGSFEDSAVFFGYDTAWVFLSSLFLFLCFSQIRCVPRWVSSLSPLAFGIYLIHEHPYVRPLLYPALGWDRVYTGAGFVKQFCFSVLVVFFACMITEWIRQKTIFSPLSALLSRLFKKGEPPRPLTSKGAQPVNEGFERTKGNH